METGLIALALVVVAGASAFVPLRSARSTPGCVRLVFEDGREDTARIVVWGVNQYGQRVSRSWTVDGRQTELSGWWWQIDSCLVVEGYDCPGAKAPAWIRTLIVEGTAGQTAHFDNTTGVTSLSAGPSRDEDRRA